MRIIHKILLFVNAVLFGILLLLQLPFYLLLEIVGPFRKEEAGQLRNKLKDWNKAIHHRLFGSLTSKGNYELDLNNEKQISVKLDPRPDAIKALPHEFYFSSNPFGQKSFVLYYEPETYGLINSYIEEHFGEIKEKLSNKGFDFIYPPIYGKLSDEDTKVIFSYLLPGKIEQGFSLNILKEVISSYQVYEELIGINGIDRPCFIRSTNEKNEEGNLYRVYYLPEDNLDLLKQSVEFYLSVVPSAYGQQRIQYSLGERYFDAGDPDELFEKADKQLSRSLKVAIEKELIKNNGMGALHMMVYLLKQMNVHDIKANEKVRSLIDQVRVIEEVNLSPIVISSTGRIFLKDYNKEINLTPLQKTVFIFFLLKEEGVVFKRLPEHKDELMKIYSKVTNRSSFDTIEQSIIDLANPYSNSMSEKCSRIKEAFVKCVDDSIAKHYYVTGGRNEPKRIVLDRKLVVFEDSIY
jgi:hypothetical protein